MAVFQIVATAVLLLLGYVVGTMLNEKRHFVSLQRRERRNRDIFVTNLKSVAAPENVEAVFLVFGEAVIATDYFKSFTASLKNLVGGEVRSFETLIDRARREATLRMIEEARKRGAREIWNVRYQTSNILSSSRRNPGVSVEVIAWGSAVVRPQGYKAKPEREA